MTPLLTGLVDDAGLFPPSSLPMAAALARHRHSASPMLSGIFLLPISRTTELLALLTDADRLRVHLIVDNDDGLVADDPRIEVVAFERPCRPLTPSGTTYVEGIPPAELAGTGLLAKVRCGGVVIPSVTELADFVTSAVRHGVAFKATAGLHRAVRGDDATDGAPHHGYLNLLLAVHRALSDGDVAAVLTTTDREALAAEARGITDPAAVRACFVSYGSCDTAQPIDDAKDLGLL